ENPPQLFPTAIRSVHTPQENAPELVPGGGVSHHALWHWASSPQAAPVARVPWGDLQASSFSSLHVVAELIAAAQLSAIDFRFVAPGASTARAQDLRNRSFDIVPKEESHRAFSLVIAQ